MESAVKQAPEGSSLAVNRAKQWQIALFPFNNAATNVYFAFMTYFTFYAVMYLTGSTAAAIGGAVVSAGLVLAVSTFTSLFVPLMRVFDGITDPPLGAVLDRLKTRFGKFRPYMVMGNIVMAISLLVMMIFFRGIPDSLSALRWVVYIVSYAVFIIGYTLQCAVTKAGQSCLTNDPKQRSQFAVWNMIGMLGSIVLVNVVAGGILTNPAICPKGTITYFDAAQGKDIILEAAAYGPQFYNIMVPLVIILSAVYTIMAIIAISEKDKPQFWGVSNESAKMKDYVGIVKQNKEMRWLVLSAGFNKLASTVATSAAVAFLLFGCLMNDYNGLFIPFYALCFVFMAPFLVWGAKVGGRKGQKRAVTQFTAFAILFYIGLTIVLAFYNHENPATHLSLFTTEGGFKLTINFYTIVFMILYGCGYGAFNVCDQMTIPMIADVTDYETYRSGKYVPGIMGTLFSLIDKIISSLQVLLLQIFIVFMVPGLNALPGETTPYMPGMQLSAIFCFCLLPMASWLITLFCMTRYRLSGKKLEEIQAVNSVRKAAVAGGMTMEQAMETWKTIDQVPAEFIPVKKPRIDKKTGEEIIEKENILDVIYKKVWAKKESIVNEPSARAIPIPEEYAEGKEILLKAMAESNGGGNSV